MADNTNFNNGYDPNLNGQTGAPQGSAPVSGTPSGSADGSYHYTGAQGSYGSTGAADGYNQQTGYAAQGQNQYQPNGYQGERGSGAIPEYKYSSVPPKKPKKRRHGLVIAAVSLGMVCVIGLSVFAGVLLSKKITLSTSTAANANSAASTSQADHLVINSTPETSTSTSTVVSNSGNVLTTAEIYAKVNNSVVAINLYQNGSATAVGEASGIVLDTNGYIITNAHVVSDGYAVSVEFADGTERNATVVGYDTRTDLAVVKIDPIGLTLVPAEFGDSDSLSVGDKVIVIGNADGFFNSVTEGIVSGLNREVSTNIDIKLIQTDAAINPGNSGGALVNEYGQVVGINSSKIASSEVDSVGFSIPINGAKTVIDSLINYGYVKGRVALGVSVVALNSTNGGMMGLPSAGLYIASINSDSDLYAQGVTRGDVILTVEGQTMSSTTDLVKILEKYSVGDTVSLTIYKSSTGKTVSISAKLSELTANN